MPTAQALHTHLQAGVASVCRAWSVTRKDGVQFGFTDHDCDLSFDGYTFKADSGLSAKALQQATGLSVDNTEAMGALSDASIREEDIAAGRFDGAEVTAWLVNWADVEARRVMFRGSIGEMRRGGGAFHAELRGLTEALGRPIGRGYQKPCSAVLGDRNCQFDLDTPGYFAEVPVLATAENRVFEFEGLAGFDPDWFQRGRLEIISGAAAGLTGAIKRDRFSSGVPRRVEIWEPLRAMVAAGDVIRLVAGCDKRMESCRVKFSNLLNFQGFPDIPEDDWVTVHPTLAKKQNGGSRR